MMAASLAFRWNGSRRITAEDQANVWDWISGSANIGASFVVYSGSGLYWARNGTTGLIDNSGSDARVVIQTVIDALTNGGLIHIKSGTYDIGRDGGTSGSNVRGYPILLKSNITLTGDGLSTILKMKNYQSKVGNDITDLVNTHGAPSILTTSDWSGLGANNNIIIRNLQLDGNRANQNQASPNNTEHDAINLVGTKQALIEAVY